MVSLNRIEPEEVKIVPESWFDEAMRVREN